MSSSVIISPDLFAEQLSRYGRLYQEATLLAPRRAHASRRHLYKQAAMCGECLFGKHLTCTSAGCSCIHRENEPFA
jgi:hypothetical protein